MPAPEVKEDHGEWVEVYCMNGACRGKQRGGKGFTTLERKAFLAANPRFFIECNECKGR